MTKIKTLRGHTAVARFIAAELADDGSDVFGYLPRHLAPAAQPYRYSPTQTVYKLASSGALVVILETAHRKVEVWTVDAATVTDLATAENAYIATLKGAR